MPPKRGAKKGAKKGAAPADDVLEQIRHKLERGPLSPQDALRVLGCAQPCPGGVYDRACKGRRDNPNCLHGLVPPEGSYRRKGLWQKDVGAMTSLGADPNDLKREASTPCGLRNLGNTCYVNSVLQCLFTIRSFRSALYSLEPSLAEQPVIKQLRELFADMEWGPRAYVDPTSFAESLDLDHTVQQDGQEFMKLLLQWLDERLVGSQRQDVRSLVPELFRGTLVYETQCQVCGRLSGGSRVPADWYELPVPVKGVASVQEGLASTLAPEFLEGDNAYHCEHCAAKVDARRQLAIKSLPPILCVSLQRFVFDMKTLAKVKVHDKVSFPMQLDLQPLVGDSVQRQQQQGEAGGAGRAEGAGGGGDGGSELRCGLRAWHSWVEYLNVLYMQLHL